VATFKPRNSLCTLPVNKGSCQATLRRFYFDPALGNCKLFIFGGCQGNDNNFETMDSCLETCAGPAETHSEVVPGKFRPYAPEIVGKSRRPLLEVRAEDERHETAVASPLVASPSLDHSGDVCQQSKSFGTCLTVSFRFYYDAKENACKRFRYSGCGGNGNNFLSADDCVRTCGGLLNVDRRAPAPKVNPLIIKGDLSATSLQGHKERLESSLAPQEQARLLLLRQQQQQPQTQANTVQVHKDRLVVRRFTTVATTTSTTTSAPRTTTTTARIDLTTAGSNEISAETPRPTRPSKLRIKQRRRLFAPTRERFVPSSARKANSSEEEPPKTTTESAPITPINRSRGRFIPPPKRPRLLPQKNPTDVVKPKPVANPVDLPETVKSTGVLLGTGPALAAGALSSGPRRPSSSAHRFRLNQSVQKILLGRARVTGENGGDDDDDVVEEEDNAKEEENELTGPGEVSENFEKAVKHEAEKEKGAPQFRPISKLLSGRRRQSSRIRSRPQFTSSSSSSSSSEDTEEPAASEEDQASAASVARVVRLRPSIADLKRRRRPTHLVTPEKVRKDIANIGCI